MLNHHFSIRREKKPKKNSPQNEQAFLQYQTFMTLCTPYALKHYKCIYIIFNILITHTHFAGNRRKHRELNYTHRQMKRCTTTWLHARQSHVRCPYKCQACTPLPSHYKLLLFFKSEQLGMHMKWILVFTVTNYAQTNVQLDKKQYCN